MTVGTADVVNRLMPEIRPRRDWGADLPVVGEIQPEDEVRFLLVHHTASTNDYGPDDVVDQIRRFHGFHTSPDKGWPDVAYNFFIDRFGQIWEGRAGSTAGPVRGDATGGSQGFALLCSLVGNHAEAPVSPEANESLVALLAWLAERHSIDTRPGATVEFVSRGSNRWPAGSVVTASTIAGHRDMSQTACPGDFAYDLLAVDLPTLVTDRRLDAAAAVQQEENRPTTSSTTSSKTSSTTSTSQTTDSAEGAAPTSTGGDGLDQQERLTVLGAAATATAAAVALLIRFRGRTERPTR